MKCPLLISIAMALTGCTASYTEPTLATDHPANANASEAPRLPTSATLDLSAADPVTPEPAERAGDDMGHAAVPEASSPGAEGGAHEHLAPATTPEGAAAAYACPMHPEVTSDLPDQRCPKCGMKLKKQDGGTPR